MGAREREGWGGTGKERGREGLGARRGKDGEGVWGGTGKEGEREGGIGSKGEGRMVREYGKGLGRREGGIGSKGEGRMVREYRREVERMTDPEAGEVGRLGGSSTGGSEGKVAGGRERVRRAQWQNKP